VEPPIHLPIGQASFEVAPDAAVEIIGIRL